MNGVGINSLTTPGFDSLRLFTLRRRTKNLSPQTQKHCACTLGGFYGFMNKAGVCKPAEVTAHYLRTYLEDCKACKLSSETIDTRYGHPPIGI